MTTQDARPLSGRQITIDHGPYSATIAAVGATLRTLTYDGRDLVVPFDADEVRPAYRGAVLVPWPNRIVDGTYTFDGVEHRLPLTEPERGHALHGLLVWSRFDVQEATASSVVLTAEVVPSDGYPFPLDVTVTYALSDSGLSTTVETVNRGDVAAPYGTAPHPYLVAGPGRVDDWTLELPASRFLDVTEDRLIPTALGDVASRVEFDFRSPRVLGDVFVDHAFTGLERTSGGDATVIVTAPSGTGVSMTWGEELPWVQIHTADRPDPAVSRLGLAVEPMTCPPDAFSSGTDLVRLEPGASHAASWEITAL
ncbi:Aldose 1-epimerase [Frondihabitans sp. 762G35]|uniref:aldose 1-epimerase family protein n=1 Tax=Frondihabitans sp. 762G35 TaxID=1446794 RepID=UPI000D1FFE53|nr:aldose 1-epimerase family protein [Frondihabitans sp. 762G35]ARC57727.1 Aldose 1-epimerase [Frondihabitans sp. 762G35]